MKIVWHEIVTPTGVKSVMVGTGYNSGLYFIDHQQWCKPCDRVCAHFGFAVIAPGPLGEPTAFHIKGNPDLMI